MFAGLLRLQPGAEQDPKSIGVLGTNEVAATLYIVTKQQTPPETVSRLRSVLARNPAVLAGVTELPNGCGAAVRLLGASSKAVRTSLHAAWNAARLQLLGAPAPDLRKG